MSINWTPEDKERYRVLIVEQMQRGCWILSLLGTVLFPAFAFLDYYTQYDHVRELWTIRACISLVFGFFSFLIHKWPKMHYPAAYAVTLVSLSSLSISLMCVVLGGFSSPYYAGVNLVVLATVLVLPIDPRKMSFAVAAVIGIYLMVLASRGLKQGDVKFLVNNLHFLLATGIIGVAAAYLKEILRKESFDRYLQIERAQNLLQAELQSEQGNVDLLIQELTERKSELQRTLLLRDEFISLASHELNTPLTSLKLQTEMARRKMGNDPGLNQATIDKLILTYDSQLKRLIRIVSDMLDISRIGADKLQLEYSEVDLELLVKEVMERISGDSSPEGSTFRLRTDGRVLGRWDSFRIEQVIINLMTNALKYGKGKPVDISVFRSGGKAVVEVRDSGIGISEENQKRIFERFERAVVSRDFSGLGLGLYICRKIVEEHGGTIQVASGLGTGSTFRVELPLTTR